MLSRETDVLRCVQAYEGGRGMVSEYLKQTRSIEELEALFEKDRHAAAKVATVVLNHEVTVGITNIGEIHQIANARIFADSQAASS